MPTTQPNVHENINSLFLPPPYQPSSSSIVLNQFQNGPQPFVISGIFTNGQPIQGNIQTVDPIVGTKSRSFTTEAKTLGAMQITIGLFHFGLGIVLGLLCINYLNVMTFWSLAFFTGYPFWGGLSFIITGALSVAAINQPNLCLIRGSLGMNIMSAIFVFFGVIFLLIDEGINGTYQQDFWAVLSGRGISALLAIFSVVEFIINCITVHLAKQAIRTSEL
ncbi:PREDICTED: membrane-spanning 4-domains subfamily A member 12 [Condylura cristata]|uniref:membrane-spanning 4-domains subfamily A member 12 n=1 Tax=Condylura cristata TaxID=143302 RepID=UPI00033462BF|nr:PREDICTED: membrane-spanning 4-domains subfamily A member 12 [Condylura cristata]